ncbi:MAG: ribonuclease HII [Parvibaculum sp.]|uniref:ribonuclease HII n=1 Tax=Parvibaculum sp. TaxID=2024848 RepID=UPI0025E81D0B|nr:ribonuclease HII [Parvibaculum sp.]MCE9649964.1 ribonuclease HII [Parvibaculum sp.]
MPRTPKSESQKEPKRKRAASFQLVSEGPTYAFEIEHGAPHRRVCGIDEAGRGPLAGPVVAAAVVIDAENCPEGLNDSKKLDLDRREELYAKLVTCAEIGVGIASVEEIDRLNILWASMLAMSRALEALAVAPAFALIDGNRVPAIACPGRAIIGGDGLVVSIAAASIVAKVTRDRLMFELAAEHAGYGWETNRGYGTPEHLNALNRLGATPHHRRSFAPVRNILSPEIPGGLDIVGEIPLSL